MRILCVQTSYTPNPADVKRWMNRYDILYLFKMWKGYGGT